MKEQPDPHLILVLDGSSSMQHRTRVGDGFISLYGIAMEAFNHFMDEQESVIAPCDLTIRIFRGGHHDKSMPHVVDNDLCTAVPISKSPRLTAENYRPEGGTNIRGCMVRTIEEFHNRPSFMCVLTDGEDGAFSQVTTGDAVDRATRNGWGLAYIGFGNDAPPGTKFCIPAEQSVRVPSDNLSAGLKAALSTLSVAVTMWREGVSSGDPISFHACMSRASMRK